MEVQKQKYITEVDNAVIKTRESLRDQLAQARGFNPEVANYEDIGAENFFWSGIKNVPEEEINKLIKQSLKDYNIQLPFEYCFTQRGLIENSSKNYAAHMSGKAFEYQMTRDGSYEMLLYIKQPKNYIAQRNGWMFAASAIFSLMIIAAFALTIRTMFNQKKLSEIKTDFINNMTHEFKTPIATISLAADALAMEKVRSNPQMLSYYSGIIKSENKRMNKQVETILQAAQIDKSELKLKLAEINMHELIDNVSKNFQVQIEPLNGTLTKELKANQFVILGDEVHISNMLTNLLDNAVKYSEEQNVRIHIETLNAKGHLIIKISDEGVGMSKETQLHIFEKFYRAHTGNLHNIKGFGLGLSYVKAIAEGHKGTVKVDSTPGKGSTFTIELPLAKF